MVAAGVVLAGLSLGGLALTAGSGRAGPAAGASTAVVKQQAARAYGRLPLRFEPNRGQTDARVDFLARGAGYTLFLTPRETVLALARPARGGAKTTGATVRMRMAGANPHPRSVAASRLPGTSNYLTGKDRKGWHTGVPGYRRVGYENVYPKTDVVYYGRQGKIEYDFVLAPGADPGRIALDFTGARRLRVTRGGDLLLHTRAGTVRQPKPLVYQHVGGARRTVAGRYVLKGHRVRFRVGAYDRTRQLVIDPALTYSTFLGGESEDFGQAVAIDPACSANCAAYVTGSTASIAFPTRNPVQGNLGDPRPLGSYLAPDAFVAKLSPDGSALEYSTYLGGNYQETGYDIAVEAGRAYVIGNTYGGEAGKEFPTTAAAYSRTCGGCSQSSNADGFLAVFEPDGTLRYSTFLGGASADQATGVAARDGKAYVSGTTQSDGFPTTEGAYDRVCGTAAVPCAGGYARSDYFVAEVDPAASGNASLLYSTFLGGSAGEPFGASSKWHNIAVDAAGNAYVAGQTASTDFPVTTGASRSGATDGFVTKLDPSGSSLVYSTLLGGGAGDWATAIEVDSSDNAYVTGATFSTDFPVTADAYDTTANGNLDAFVAKLSPSGTGRVYATYLGGSASDQGSDVAVDGGRAYVALITSSQDFPVAEPVTARNRRAGAFMGFVTEMTSNGSAVLYSTPLTASDGNEDDVVLGIAVDAGGSAYAAGSANGTISEFPTTPGSFQTDFGGGSGGDGGDAFFAKLSPVSPPAPYVTRVSPPGGPEIGGTSVTITGTGFAGASAVRFGSVAAQSFQVESGETITAVSPRHPSGEPAITVTTPDGTSPANPIARFTYGEGLFRTTAATTVSYGRPVALKDGGVLQFNNNSAAQRYDPKTGEWTTTDAPLDHGDYTATLLRDGRVLVVGDPNDGYFDDGTPPVDNAELYDPATGGWTIAANPVRRRGGHTATLLWGPACEASPAPAYCGKVLIAGGRSYDPDLYDTVALSSSELYDPATDTWSPADPLGTARYEHTATLLAGTPCTGSSPPGWCGKVLVAGGRDAAGSRTESAELYDPAADRWSETESLPLPRSGHRATGMLNGTVLIPGGVMTRGLDASPSLLYHPDAANWTLAPRPPYALFQAGGLANALPNGKALFYGAAISYAHLFDPALRSGAGDWAFAGRRLPGRTGQSAVLLSGDPIGDDLDPSAVGSRPDACGTNCGKVLDVAGELYTPAPSVRSVAPTGGASDGGTTVSITGTGFTHNVRSVMFGGAAATSYTVDSYSQITAVAPAHGAGTVDVVVTNEGGEAAGRFAYAAGAGPSPSGSPTPSSPGPGPAGGTGRDTTRPVISGLRAFPARFRIGSLLPRLAHVSRVGTRISFSLSERAAVRLSFARRHDGRRVAGRCRAATFVLRHRPRCVRYVTVFPSLRFARVRAGANRVRFQGRLSARRRLRPGHYRLTAVATDPAGNRSRPRRTLLTARRR